MLSDCAQTERDPGEVICDDRALRTWNVGESGPVAHVSPVHQYYSSVGIRGDIFLHVEVVTLQVSQVPELGIVPVAIEPAVDVPHLYYVDLLCVEHRDFQPEQHCEVVMKSAQRTCVYAFC